MSKMKFLEKVEVKSPCLEDWNEMRGNDKARFCSHCSKSVNNLSTMTRQEALKIVKESNGNLCVRYVKNPVNSAPLFARDLYQIARRAPRLAVGVMTAALSLSSIAYAQGSTKATREPTDKIETSHEEKDAAKNKSALGTISGTIMDSTGAVVPGIVVSLAVGENSTGRTATSNDEGFYEFRDLAPETYTLKAEAAGGFIDSHVEGITVDGGDESKIDVTMQVGEETVMMGVVAVMPEYELPLLQAVSDENAAEVKSLLANGAAVNGKDKNFDGITALFVAVENGNVEITRTLLEFGAKANARSDEKLSPLMRLDADATPELVKLLLSYGAKIKAIDKDRNTVLHHVAASVEIDVLQLLIDEGAKINEQNNEQETPLMIAAENGNLEAVRTLLNHGADVNLRNDDEQTALAIALDNGYEEIVELLISYGAAK